MARRVALVLVAAILLSTASANIALSSGVQITESPDFPGCVLVGHPGAQYGQVKAIVQKGDQRYTYDIRLTEDPECLPLQMGDGDYTVRLMKRTTGNRYQEVARKYITIEQLDEQELFLSSVQNVAWKDSPELVKLAEELTESCETNAEKVEIVREYIMENMEYDYDKARTVASGYLPDLDQVLLDEKGICYDFASLFAGMLRSVGIPTKLVTGYVGPQRAYHAWSEVYDGDSWQRYDLTRDVTGGRKVPVTSTTINYETRYVF